MEVVLLMHLLLSVIAAMMGVRNVNPQERLCNFIIAFFIPLAGFLFVLILYGMKKRISKELDIDDDFDNTMILFTERINIEKDINIISLEESLLINDVHTKRRQLLDALKMDASKYIDALKIALMDTDSETSHYAASAIAEIKRNLDLRIQEIEVLYEKNKSDVEILKQYAAVIEEYLSSNLLDELDTSMYLYTYIQLLESLIELESNNMRYYDQLTQALYRVQEYQKMGDYCQRFLNKYETENAYISNLKYCYQINDKENFKIILNKLKHSQIKLSHKGRNIIRFWIGDAG